jgi:hypothetical protein
VLNLRSPSDYEPKQGARFLVHFEKARGLNGEQTEPFEAKLETRDGKAVWSMRSVEEAESSEIDDLKRGRRFEKSPGSWGCPNRPCSEP